MRRSTRTGLLACAWLTVALAGCGGGGSGGYSSSTPPPPAPTPAPAPPTSAEGVYQGTLSGSASSAFQMLVLETGEYWLLYGSITNNAFTGAGFVHGTGSTSAAPTGVAFISSDALDYFTTTSPPVAGSLSAVYTGTSLDGTLSGSGGAVTFSGALLTTGNYNYASAPSLSDIAGPWQLNDNSLAMQVNASGAFTVTQSGCTVSGSFVPRASGKNVFDVTMTIGAAPCNDPGGARTGIAITYPTGGGKQQLIVLSTDTANPSTTGSAWAGTR